MRSATGPRRERGSRRWPGSAPDGRSTPSVWSVRGAAPRGEPASTTSSAPITPTVSRACPASSVNDMRYSVRRRLGVEHAACRRRPTPAASRPPPRTDRRRRRRAARRRATMLWSSRRDELVEVGVRQDVVGRRDDRLEIDGRGVAQGAEGSKRGTVVKVGMVRPPHRPRSQAWFERRCASIARVSGELLVLCDLDGVIWLAHQAHPRLGRCDRPAPGCGRDRAFVTNNRADTLARPGTGARRRGRPGRGRGADVGDGGRPVAAGG